MPWPEGKSRGAKTGGRRKGTPNRRTLLLADILEKAGLDVPVRVSELLPALSPKEQVDVLLKLMEYLYPKRKAIEVKNEDLSPTITHQKIMDYIYSQPKKT